MSIPDAPVITALLLAWYRREARDLPWRADPTPYKVLLSELMLQQTRVDTALPYFARFLERWPTLEDLAAASEAEVVEAWAGLGYYRRARHLHAAARRATEAGGLPADPEALQALPGIGRYTAGAVASIAFGVAAPVVDGNVSRVLSRLDARHERPDTAAGQRALWARAQELLPEERPGDLNQALMELGALVCTPRAPECPRCPLEALCLARARGVEGSLPVTRKRKPPRVVPMACGLARQGALVLAGRRPRGRLLGGLWEPVCVELPGATEAAEALRLLLPERIGAAVVVGGCLGRAVHVLTHRRLEVAVHHLEVRGAIRAGGPYAEVAWVDPSTGGWSALGRRLVAVGDDPQLTLLAADGPG